MKSIVERTIREGLNVRQLEKLIQQANENVSRETSKRKPPEKACLFGKANRCCAKNSGRTSRLNKRGKEEKLKLRFFSPEDLERILELLDVRFDE